MVAAFVPLLPWPPAQQDAITTRSTFITSNNTININNCTFLGEQNVVLLRKRRRYRDQYPYGHTYRIHGPRKSITTTRPPTASAAPPSPDDADDNYNDRDASSSNNDNSNNYSNSNSNTEKSGEMDNEMEEWYAAIEAVFTEALTSYYEYAPLYSEAEFNALRDELDHLAKAQMRLGRVENVWMSATSARDFDRRMRTELDMSADEYEKIKARVIAKNPLIGENKTRASKKTPNDVLRSILPSAGRALLGGANTSNNNNSNTSTLPTTDDGKRAEKIEWRQNDGRLKWFLFGNASEEKLKVAMLYFPAVLMCLAAISILTILFANLDGEMRISVSHKGQVRLGVLTYIAIACTAYFSDKVTPIIMEYLDLGQPTLLRGECPNCSSNISCLFTGQTRTRDERKCKVCGATVGFNRKYSKVFLVDEPGDKKIYRSPD